MQFAFAIVIAITAKIFLVFRELRKAAMSPARFHNMSTSTDASVVLLSSTVAWSPQQNSTQLVLIVCSSTNNSYNITNTSPEITMSETFISEIIIFNLMTTEVTTIAITITETTTIETNETQLANSTTAITSKYITVTRST